MPYQNGFGNLPQYDLNDYIPGYDPGDPTFSVEVTAPFWKDPGGNWQIWLVLGILALIALAPDNDRRTRSIAGG